MTNKEEFLKSFEHLKYIKKHNTDLCNKYIERAKKIFPGTRFELSEYTPPKITEFGVEFRDAHYLSYFGQDLTLKWKYINMSDEEFELELKKIEEEKKRKEILELQTKLLKLTNG